MLKRLTIALLVLVCLLPVLASAMVQSPVQSLQAPSTQLAHPIFPNAPSYPHETLVIIGYSDDSVRLWSCRNNPMGGYDALGLATVEEARASMNEAIAALKRYDRLAGNYASVEATLFGGGDYVYMQGEGGLTKLNRGSSEAQTLVLLAAVMKFGAENVLPPDFTSFGSELASGQAGLASADMRTLYKHAAFQEWAGRLPSGSICPEGDSFFDTDSSEFKASRRQGIALMLNPSADIARHAVHGDYGEAAKAYGKEVAIWSAFMAGGEFLGTGRVAFGLGGRAPVFTGANAWRQFRHAYRGKGLSNTSRPFFSFSRGYAYMKSSPLKYDVWRFSVATRPTVASTPSAFGVAQRSLLSRAMTAYNRGYGSGFLQFGAESTWGYAGPLGPGAPFFYNTKLGWGGFMAGTSWAAYEAGGWIWRPGE